MALIYDFAIVGSGPSGGTIARNLHEAGAKVVLLEAGKYFNKDSFPRSEADYSAQLFWGGGIEFDDNAKTAFLRAKCVGGTSIVNQALMDRFDEIAFNDWRRQSGVDFFTSEAMAPYYSSVEKKMELHTYTAAEFNRNAELFTTSCSSLGYKWKFLRRGQRDCKLKEGNDCIGCLGGCHLDSKQSSLVVSIQVAEKTGMEVVSEYMVNAIEHHKDVVVINGLHKEAKKSFRCKKVILAAGSFGTTKLMFNSGFGSKLPALGEGFCQHPQYMSFGIFKEPVDSHKGAFQTVASNDPDFRQRGFKLENVYAGPISIGMLFNSFGKEHQRLMKNYRYMACIEVAVRDEPAGYISVDKKGKLVVSKPLTTQDMKRRDDGLYVVDRILESAGALEVIRSPYFFGLHLMGGCAIGTDAATSVVNPDFQVHGLPNIYIADSSIYPSAPGINPSLSIMAFSQKLSEQLIKS